MNELELTYREDRLTLMPEDDFTFGRDPQCRLQLDAADRGISRLAGAFRFQHGTWWVINLSRNRALHVVDNAGFATPLPVAAGDDEPSRRAVIPPSMTVLVAGDIWTHALSAASDNAGPKFETLLPADPLSTMSQLPALTDNRKEAIVALVSGYLKPFPHYDPRPRTYAEAAVIADLRPDQVRKRVETVRGLLTQRGVPGLEGDEAPRRFAEWVLAMRIVTPSDLEWLKERIDLRVAEAEGVEDDELNP